MAKREYQQDTFINSPKWKRHCNDSHNHIVSSDDQKEREQAEDILVDDDVPTIIVDNISQRTFTRGQCLGEGSFARCFSVIDVKSSNIFAVKIIPKKKLTNPLKAERAKREAQLHTALNHPNIVKMYYSFKDCTNVYMILELCTNKTLMHLIEDKGILTKTDSRDFLYQIASACEYLHERNIIHRDLKPENLFLTNLFQIKVGDFGLAIMTKTDEKRNRFCGTPNYIAPEMLKSYAYSFEVDIWAVGCILFTMLVGKPPFTAETTGAIFSRITENNYIIPQELNDDSAILITQLLNPLPALRPKAQDIAKFPFFKTI